MKEIFYGFVVCLFLFSVCVSRKKEVPKKVIDRNETPERVINEAIARFDEENGLNSHQNYDISVREATEEWDIYFEGKIKLPGNHAFVRIKKSTGEIEYFQGE